MNATTQTGGGNRPGRNETMSETTPENWSAAFADSDVIERRLLVLGTPVAWALLYETDLGKVWEFPRDHRFAGEVFMVVDISPKGTRAIIKFLSGNKRGKRYGWSAFCVASILREGGV